MAKNEIVISVFVASPDDVKEEREKLEEVIRELNSNWSRNLGVRLDLIRWETDTFPGVGEDAQAVVNEQIPDDYDIFIGIMWCRYGTKTKRADSGTVEEFEKAFNRYKNDDSSVKIMMYFKDEQINPSKINPAQFMKVLEFKEKLKEEGFLVGEFKNIEHFEDLIRMNLTRQIQEILKTADQKADENKEDIINDKLAEDKINDEDNEDLGILDLVEIFEEKFAELKNSTDLISKATEDLGYKMNERTTEMNALPKDISGHAGPRTAKKLIKKAASDMDYYSARVEAEIPIFRGSLSEGMDSLIKAASMTVDLLSDDLGKNQALEGLQAIKNLQSALSSTDTSIKEFRDIVAKYPRMTSDLNKAKKRLVKAMDQLLGEIGNGIVLLQEGEKVVGRMLGEN